MSLWGIRLFERCSDTGLCSCYIETGQKWCDANPTSKWCHDGEKIYGGADWTPTYDNVCAEC